MMKPCLPAILRAGRQGFIYFVVLHAFSQTALESGTPARAVKGVWIAAVGSDPWLLALWACL